MKKLIKISGLILIVCLVLVGVKAVQAQMKLMPDPKISAVSVAPSSPNNASATVSYTLTLTISQALAANSTINMSFRGQGCPFGVDWRQCSFTLDNATISGGIAGNKYGGGDTINLRLTSAVSAGTYNVVVGNVVNPAQAGSYQVHVNTAVEGGMPAEGTATTSNAIIIGTMAIQGTVRQPGGTPLPFAWVQVRTEDFSFQIHGNTDANGFYAIPAQGMNVGGSYKLDVGVPPNVQGVISPDPFSFTYAGTTIIRDVTLAAASKKITGKVIYDKDGAAVTTAQIFASKRGGGSGMGVDVGADGTFTLLVSGGSWDVGLSAKWNQETQQPIAVDWANPGPPTTIEFSQDTTAETKTVDFTVQKATAVITGKIVKPDGVTPVRGNLDVRNQEGKGNGTNIDERTGVFRVNVPVGDYRISVWLDSNRDSSLAKLYVPEMKIRVGENETRDLGTIVLKEKTSKISGKVVDSSGNGVSGVRLNAWLRDGQGNGQATSGADGSWLMWVTPGTWEAQIDTWGGSDPEQKESFAKYIPIGARPNPATVLEGQEITGINFTVKLADAQIQVKLVDSSGQAITNLFGYAYARKKGGGFGPGNEYGSGIDRGTATIYLLGGETYTVGAHLPPEGSDFSLKEEIEVTVAAGEKKAINLTMVANDATITGFVKDQTGKLVTGVEGEVNAQGAADFSWKPTRLKPDGSFSISVRGGREYSLGVFIRNDDYLKAPPNMVPFTVPVGGSVTKIVTIFKANAYISGKVLDPDGKPIGNAWVGANNFRFMEGKVKGDFEKGKVIDTGTQAQPDGTFKLPIVAGDFEVFAGLPPEFSSYMPPKEQGVSIKAGQTVTVTLQFRSADATLKATVKMPDGSAPKFGFCWAWSEEGGHSGNGIMEGKANVPLTIGSWHVGCDSHDPATKGFYRSPETIITIKSKGDLAQAFTLAKGGFDIPEGISDTFDSTSQKVLTLPDGTTVTIPASALGTSGNVTVTANPDVNLFHTQDTKPINFAWDFEALNSSNQPVTSFNSNVNICIPYSEDAIKDLGVKEDEIIAKYYDETAGAWKMPDGVTQDTDNNVVCFSVSHFTNYALATGGTAGQTKGPQYIIAVPQGNAGPRVVILDSKGKTKLSFFAYDSSSKIAIQALSGDVNGDGLNEIVTAPGSGAGPQIKVFNTKGKLLKQFFAFDKNMTTGVNIALGDVNGDGVDEIIAVPMAGPAAEIKVFNGSGKRLAKFWAYSSSFKGGVSLAVIGDINKDNKADLAVMPASDGGAKLKFFGGTGKVINQSTIYDSKVKGGFNLTVGDVTGDGTNDLVVSPKAGLALKTLVMDMAKKKLATSFFAYGSSFKNGVLTSVGDTDGDGKGEVVVSPESGAGSQIKVFSSAGKAKASFFAYDKKLKGKFTAFVKDLDGNGTAEIVTVPGAGAGPQVKVFNQKGRASAQFFSHSKSYKGGVSLSSIPAF